MEKLYTVEEVAEILSIEASTCKNWIRDGKIPHIKLNGSTKAIRIPRSLLDAYIQRTMREQAHTAQLDEYAAVPEVQDDSIYSFT
jgi:excisionase family DNA binding protein